METESKPNNPCKNKSSSPKVPKTDTGSDSDKRSNSETLALKFSPTGLSDQDRFLAGARSILDGLTMQGGFSKWQFRFQLRGLLASHWVLSLGAKVQLIGKAEEDWVHTSIQGRVYGDVEGQLVLFKLLLYENLRHLVIHELDEALHFDGKQFRNPHPERL